MTPFSLNFSCPTTPVKVRVDLSSRKLILFGLGPLNMGMLKKQFSVNLHVELIDTSRSDLYAQNSIKLIVVHSSVAQGAKTKFQLFNEQFEKTRALMT